MMSPTELADVGCNVSTTHQDVMISDDQTKVAAHTDHGVVVLIEKGHWVI